MLEPKHVGTKEERQGRNILITKTIIFLTNSPTQSTNLFSSVKVTPPPPLMIFPLLTGTAFYFKNIPKCHTTLDLVPRKVTFLFLFTLRLFIHLFGVNHPCLSVCHKCWFLNQKGCCQCLWQYLLFLSLSLSFLQGLLDFNVYLFHSEIMSFFSFLIFGSVSSRESVTELLIIQAYVCVLN